MREGTGPVLLRMLLMVAACNAVRMTAMHVVAYGWVLVVAVGSSEMKVLPYDVCALRPYWWPLPPGPWVGCWGRLSPPAGRIYSAPSAGAV